MIFGKEDIEQQIEVLNSRIENEKDFVYLGSVLTWDNGCSKDIRARINKAKGVMAGFGEIWPIIWGSKEINTIPG